MYVNADQIKIALIDIAEEAGRPHFELSVIRDVIDSIKNNSHHHLKTRVLARIKADLQDRVASKDSEQAIRLKKMRSVCKGESIKRQIGDESGLGLKYINYMVRGRYEINNSVWARIEPLLNQFDQNIFNFKLK